MKLKLFIVAGVLHLLEAKRSKPSVSDFVDGKSLQQGHRYGISPESIEANILDWWFPEAPTDEVIENDDWESDEDEEVEFRPEE